MKDGSLGYLEFCVYDVEYRLPIEHLELMYGFPSGKDTSHCFDKRELQSFWATLGSKHGFSSYRTKSNEIRSAVVRYFHRSLASALFPRERNETNVNGELELMETTLQELLGLASDGTVLAGDQTDTSVSFYLIEHLLSYRGWAKGLQKPGKMVVREVVTPILRACNVPLHSMLIPPIWIDMEHLINSRSFWLQQKNGLYKYRFDHPTAGQSIFLLPNPASTSIRDGGNIEFCPPMENLYISGDEAVPMEGMNDDEAPIHHSDNEAEPMDESYDTQQFYCEEYSAPRQSKDSKEIHKRLGFLQSWCKFQDKALAALNKKFNNLQLKISCSSSTTAMPHNMPFGRSGSTRHEPMHFDPPSPPRQSSYEPREHHAAPAPPRQSSFEPREKEKRSKLKKRRRTRKSDTGASHSTAPLEEPLDQ